MASGSTLILPSITPAHSIGKGGYGGVSRPFDLLVSGLHKPSVMTSVQVKNTIATATPSNNKNNRQGGRSSNQNQRKSSSSSSHSSSRDNTPRNRKSNHQSPKHRSTHSKNYNNNNNNQAIETMFSQLKSNNINEKKKAEQLPSISTNVSQLFQTFTQNNDKKKTNKSSRQRTASNANANANALNLFAQKAESDSHDRRRGSGNSNQSKKDNRNLPLGLNKSTRHNKSNNGNWSAHSSSRNSNSDSTSERPSRQNNQHNNNNNGKPVKGCYIRVATLVEAKELKTVDSFAATLNSFNTTKIVHNFGGRNDRVSNFNNNHKLNNNFADNKSNSNKSGHTEQRYGSESNVNKIKIVDNCRFAGYAASPDADSLPQPPMAWLDMDIQKSFEVGTYSS